MNQLKSTGANIESLMDMLTSDDGMLRQKARKSLVALGKPAVSSLIHALKYSQSNQVRWEAAKALGAISNTRSIPPLVKALEDSDTEVAWLAAKALIKFKKAAWPQLLHSLIKGGSDSVALRRGAHHVLRNQKEEGFNPLLTTLKEALQSSIVPESMAVAADDILQRMKAPS